MNEHKDEIWVTKEGREIPVSQLSEQHAKAILRMLIRNKRRDDEYDIIDASTSDIY